MEALTASMHSRGTTLETDTQERLRTRPVPPSGSNQQAFQNLGSSLEPPKKGANSSRAAPSSSQRSHASSQNDDRTMGKGKLKPVVRTGSGASSTKRSQNKRIVLDSEDSDDELDFLSQTNSDDPSCRSSPVRSQDGRRDDHWRTIADGSKRGGDKGLVGQAEARTQTLKGLKFNKTKTAKPVAPVVDIDDDDDSFAMTPKPRAPAARASTQVGRPDVVPLAMTQVDTKARRSPPRRGSPPPSKRHNDNNMLLPRKNRTNTAASSEVKNKRPAAEHKGRENNPILPPSKRTSSILDMTDTVSDAERASSSKLRSRASRHTIDDSSPERIEKKKGGPDPFPINRTPPKANANKRRPRDFPELSPPPKPSRSPSPVQAKIKPSRELEAFPMSLHKYDLSDGDIPVAKAGKDKGKGKAVNKENDDDEYEDGGKQAKATKIVGARKKQLQEFPMNTQTLKSIASSSVRPRKRISEDGSGDDHTPKKLRRDSDTLPITYAFEDEGDSISIDPSVDPKTLCPYCDTPLPSSPSSVLLKILAEARKKSKSDPRPSNPRGLRAPLTIFITACQRHRFESQILPEAERKGWPKTIEWKSVSGRILKMRPFLEALIEDPGSDAEESQAGDWDVKYGGSKKTEVKVRGAKAKSIFWTEIMEEIRTKGLRAVSGVRGQFATFEKAQPGYYGEIGSVIIHQTLYNMFPLAEINPARVAPLTTNEFVQRILVPEVALHLIMEDKHLEGDKGAKDALTILRDSSAYGVAMFPEDSGEWDTGRKKNQEDKIGVGDMIVMERARKRRKELEEEDVREEQERRAMEGARKAKSRSDARGRPGADECMQASSDTGGQERPRPKPRPRTKVPPAQNTDLGDVIVQGTEDKDKNTRFTRSRSRSVASSIRGDADATGQGAVKTKSQSSTLSLDEHYLGSDSDIYLDEPSRASSVERHRSPSASETRNFYRSSDPEPPSTITRTGMSSGKIESDSDASSAAARPRRTKTIPSRAPSHASSRASSRARSVAKESTGKRQPTARDRYRGRDDEEIEIVDGPSPVTPMPRKRAPLEPFPMDVDRNDEDAETPRAAPSKSKRVPTPPLEKSRQRKLMLVGGMGVPCTSQKGVTTAGQKSGRAGKGTSNEPYSVPSDSERSVKSQKREGSNDWLLCD